MTRWVVLLGLVVACAACTTEAPAQERAPRWEHGTFEYAQLRGDREANRFRWITAAGLVEGTTPEPVWTAVGGEGAPNHDESGHMQVLDLLAAGGWELVNASDVSFVFAGGSAFANRYYLRRKR